MLVLVLNLTIGLISSFSGFKRLEGIMSRLSHACDYLMLSNTYLRAILAHFMVNAGFACDLQSSAPNQRMYPPSSLAFSASGAPVQPPNLHTATSGTQSLPQAPLFSDLPPFDNLGDPIARQRTIEWTSQQLQVIFRCLTCAALRSHFVFSQ